jgi:hypothetical protein
MALLPNGKVLIADYFQDNQNPLHNPKVWIWNAPRMDFVNDPAAWGTNVPNNRNNVFCAGHALLPDGRSFWAGGHIANFVGTNLTDIWNPSTSTWSVGPNMAYARWYPTTTVLANGKVLITSGYITPGNLAGVPELYDPGRNTMTTLTSAFRVIPDYPFFFQAPNGKLFYAGPEVDTQYLNPITWQWEGLTYTSPVAGLYSGSAVMYDKGRILKTGGSMFDNGPATAAAATVNLNVFPPVWTSLPDMHYPRFHHNLTALPDGTVLCTGGNRVYLDSGWGTRDPEPVMYAEIFTPGENGTGTWTLVPEPMATPRWYHSTAMLMPDATVVVAGGNEQQNAELFTPPYLDGITPEMRPTLTAPRNFYYGQQVVVDATPGAGTFHDKVSMIRLGAVTHAFDMNQRFLWADFDPITKRITAPANANLAPPGHYMVFVLADINGKKVPSVAAIVNLQKKVAISRIGNVSPPFGGG